MVLEAKFVMMNKNTLGKTEYVEDELQMEYVGAQWTLEWKIFVLVRQ